MVQNRIDQEETKGNLANQEDQEESRRQEN